MSTTSLKLSDELKQRAVLAAQLQGMSTHAFMIDAIERAAVAAECRAGFISDALAARDEMLKTGKGYDANEVHAYIKRRLQDRAAGVKSVRPEAKSWLK